MFGSEPYPDNQGIRAGIQPTKTPTYEDRMILYAKYIEGNDFKEYYANYWTNKEVNFDKTGRATSPPWDLINYYNYFKTAIQNKDNTEKSVRRRKTYFSIYRYNQERIINILNRFNDKESFMKLIESIHDVKVSKLMEDRDKNTLNY